MKKLILLTAVFFATFMGHIAIAQVNVSFNINSQPIWGPVGYDYVEYYYMPDIDAYYSVDTRQYTYFSGGRWSTSVYLPPTYRNYDLYHGYKVVVNEPRPWLHHDRYHREYAQYRGRRDQPFIRDSRDQRYYGNPQHPQHAQWQGSTRPGSPGNRPQQVLPPRGNGPQQHGNPGNGNHGNDHKRNDGPRGNDNRGGDHEGHDNDRGGGHGHR